MPRAQKRDSAPANTRSKEQAKRGQKLRDEANELLDAAEARLAELRAEAEKLSRGTPLAKP